MRHSGVFDNRIMQVIGREKLLWFSWMGLVTAKVFQQNFHKASQQGIA